MLATAAFLRTLVVPEVSRTPFAIVLGLAVALTLAGSSTAADATPAGPTRAEAWIARVITPTVARTGPGAGRVVARLGTRARWNGGPVGLLVLRSSTTEDGRVWLRVRLPIRPNGASGWIPADVVQLRRTAYRIEISTGRRLVRLLRGGRIIRSYGAVVGEPAYPTPHGLFAVGERVAQPDPNGFLGPWALHLTAHSNALFRFGGGPGTSRCTVAGRRAWGIRSEAPVRTVVSASTTTRSACPRGLPGKALRS